MFDPLEFFQLAKKLVNDKEVSLRTSVSRVYYACFLFSRENLNLRSKSPEIHKKVIEKLYKKDRVTANSLHILRRFRNQADYDLNIKFQKDKVKTAINLGNFVIGRIRK